MHVRVIKSICKYPHTCNYANMHVRARSLVTVSRCLSCRTLWTESESDTNAETNSTGTVPTNPTDCTATLGSHGAYVDVVYSRAESDGRRVSTRSRHRHGHRQRGVTARRHCGAGRQTTVGQQHAGLGQERRRRRDG